MTDLNLAYPHSSIERWVKIEKELSHQSHEVEFLKNEIGKYPKTLEEIHKKVNEIETILKLIKSIGGWIITIISVNIIIPIIYHFLTTGKAF